MARRRLLFSVVVSALVLLQAATLAPASAKDSGSLGALPVAISAEFDHPDPSQVGTYRTVVSSAVPVVFATDATGVMTARFGMEPADCFGLASWVPTANGSAAIGPAVLCVANGIVSEQEFNDWVDRSGQGKVDHGLVIPLGPPQPVEPIQPGQVPAQARLNADRVIAQTFVSGCAFGSFRKYGDLIFEKGTLAFRFWTDTRGRPQVDLSASLASLQNINGDTWNRIRDGCDVAHALPANPLDGHSASFAGTSFQRPPDPSLLSGQIELVFAQIDSLVFQQRLEPKAGESLSRQLGDAVTSLQATRVDQAAHELQMFRDGVAKLGQRGLLDPAAAASLAKTALGIETFLGDRANVALPPPDPLRYCSANNETCPDTVSSCQFTGWLVDAASTAATPDGTAKAPFPSIAGALAQAAQAKICGVTLFVQPGRYMGAVIVTRHTRIVGQSDPFRPSARVIIEGPVSNLGPNVLDVSNVQLSWFREASADGVLVDHPCAVTRLTDVDVLGYRGFGVRQRGGSLFLLRVGVNNTEALPDSLSHGTGMLLSCGVQGRLIDVHLDFNVTAGLLMAGPGTEVEAIGLGVRRTSVHPALTGPALGGPWGAVHVRDEARLTATSFRIADNWGIGIAVYNGAEANFDEGTITDTVDFGRFVEGWRDGGGGIGALSRWGGHLRMSNFISTRNDLCGVEVADDGAMDLRGIVTPDAAARGSFVSEVTHSPIGACVLVDGFDVSRLTNGVRYHDNGINLYGTTLLLPEPIGGLDP